MSRFPELSKRLQPFAFSDSLEYHKHLQKVFSAPQLFAIVTWGCCASTWLAKTLNSHPEIYCQHAFNQHYNCAMQTPVDNGIQYLESISITAHAYKLAGDVHGLDREMIPVLKKHFGEKIRTAVLVRDPWERFFSMLSDMRLIHGGFSDYNYTDTLLEKVGIHPDNVTLDQRLFVHSANMLNSIIAEMELSKTIFKMEEFTTSAEVLSRLIQHISAGRVSLDDKWLNSQVQSQAVNSHREKIGQDACLNSEEQRIVNIIVEDKALDLYSSLGYDVERIK